jgi:Nuclear pore complex scaffold, nucleoporins 186/192/205
MKARDQKLFTCQIRLETRCNALRASHSRFIATCGSAYRMESLERLQGLYQDLTAFSESRLANVERLWHELEASIDDFRKLLDKPPKNNASRESLAKGRKMAFRLLL